jgi:hypothetical protein
MWKVRIERRDDLRKAWRSLLRFALNSQLCADIQYQIVSHSDEKCIKYRQAFLYCNKQSIMAAVPICTKLTTGWRCRISLKSVAEYGKCGQKLIHCITWDMYLSGSMVVRQLLYRKPLPNLMIAQKWWCLQLVTERRMDIVSKQDVLLLARKECLRSYTRYYFRHTQLWDGLYWVNGK